MTSSVDVSKLMGDQTTCTREIIHKNIEEQLQIPARSYDATWSNLREVHIAAGIGTFCSGVFTIITLIMGVYHVDGAFVVSGVFGAFTVSSLIATNILSYYLRQREEEILTEGEVIKLVGQIQKDLGHEYLYPEKRKEIN